MATQKKVLVVDSPSGWARMKSGLEGQLSCEIDVFDKTAAARNALSSNCSYSLVVIDPFNWQLGGGLVEARVTFARELQNKPPILILTRYGSNVVEKRCKLVLGRDYQVHVARKYGYERVLSEEMRRLIEG